MPRAPRSSISRARVTSPGGPSITATSAPASAQAFVASGEASLLVATIIGAVPSNIAPVAGTRPRPSTSTRRGWRPRYPSSRTVSAGSSASAVPAPTTTAPDRARSRCASRAGGFAGDPPGGTVAGGGPAVERGAELERHHRQPGPDVLGESRVQAEGLVLQEPDLDVHPGIAQQREPTAVDDRIGIAQAGDHPADLRPDDRRGARRRPADVAAGLKGDEQGPAAGSLPGGAQGHDLRVIGTRALVPPLPRHRAVGGQDQRADHGIGGGEPQPTLGQLQGPAEARAVAQVRCGSPGVPLDRLSHAVPPASRGGDVRRGRTGATARAENGPSSPIPTVTVGPGVPPGQPLAGGEGVADSHRRWGFAPRPEDELVSCSEYTRGSGGRTRPQALRRSTAKEDPGSRLANCFISVATATASP